MLDTLYDNFDDSELTPGPQLPKVNQVGPYVHLTGKGREQSQASCQLMTGSIAGCLLASSLRLHIGQSRSHIHLDVRLRCYYHPCVFLRLRSLRAQVSIGSDAGSLGNLSWLNFHIDCLTRLNLCFPQFVGLLQVQPELRRRTEVSG